MKTVVVHMRDDRNECRVQSTFSFNLKRIQCLNCTDFYRSLYSELFGHRYNRLKEKLGNKAMNLINEWTEFIQYNVHGLFSLV